MQVMAGFFNSEALAKLSNLIGSTDLQFYSQTTNAIFEDLKSLITLFELYVSLYNPHDTPIMPLFPDHLEFVLLSQEDYKWAEYNSSAGSSLNDGIRMDLKVSSCIRGYALLCCKAVINIKPLNELLIDDIFPLIGVKTQELYFTLLNLYEFTQYTRELKLIFCIRYAVRIVVIGINENNPESLWFSRGLSKHATMTKLYGSTSYSRKEKYMDILNGIAPIPTHPPYYRNRCLELVSFIDRATTRFLNKQKGIALIDSFLNALSFDKPIILNNRNFKLTLSPKMETFKQISCPAFRSNIKDLYK
jgi:hypothetical protein